MFRHVFAMVCCILFNTGQCYDTDNDIIGPEKLISSPGEFPLPRRLSHACPKKKSYRYNNKQNGGCRWCIAGRYQNINNYKCPEGSNNGGGKKPSNPHTNCHCPECAVGYYAAAGSQENCKACLIGQYADATRATACKLCPIRTFADESALSKCKDCLPGYHQDVPGNSACKPCLAGKVGISPKLENCELCQPGFYQDQNAQVACKPCPSGRFNIDANQASCSDCPKGKFQDEPGKNGCKDCNPGYYNPGDIVVGANCKECPVNRYETALGQTECKQCAAGKRNVLTGQTACENCPVGRSNSVQGTNCNICAAGKYQPATTQLTCVQCPAGYVRATSVENNFYALCARRYCNSHAACKTATCLGVACALDSQSIAIWNYFNALSASDKLAQHLYDPHICNGEQCDYCVAGKVQPAVEQLNCVDCAAGKFQPATKASGCTICPLGWAITTTGATTCVKCIQGYYADEPSLLSACKACPVGWKGTVVEAATTSDTCVTCAAGKFAGPTSGQSVCQDCDVGFFLPEGNVGLLNACLECSAASTTGQSICPGCAAGKKGYQAVNTCVDCPNGYWAGGGDKDDCTVCPEGWSTTGYMTWTLTINSATITESQNVVVTQNGATGTLATALTGANVETVTVTAAVGQVFGTNNDLVIDAGETETTVLATDVTEATSAGAKFCEECPVGRYSYLIEPRASIDLTCKLCPQGYFGIGLAATSQGLGCKPCAKGFWSATDGANHVSACKACESGKYSNVPHRTEDCESCAKGQFSSLPAATEQCKVCPEGYSQSDTASANCNPCLPYVCFVLFFFLSFNGFLFQRLTFFYFCLQW